MAGFGVATCLGGSALGQALGNTSQNANGPTSASTETPTPKTATAATPGKPYTPTPGSTSAPGTTAPAQTSSTATMAPIIVTGSLIPTTADEVGPTEVEFVTDSQIKTTNANNIFDALKRIDVSLSGGGNFGQELNNNAQTVGESHFALRNLSTLVLLDGNRLTNSPLSNGAAVDVNLIPLSFIDHVEILKDGASTIYGSDAVGGVINIITKQNFSGAEVNNQYGFAGDKGNYFTDTASIIGGSTTDTTSFFAGIEYHYNNEILTKNREIASLSAPDINAKGAYAPSYYSGTVPGVVQSIPDAEGGSLEVDGSTRFIIAGSPYAQGAPGYNAAITTPTALPANFFTSPDNVRLADLANSGYIPVGSLPTFPSVGNTFLNTTQFGTYSYTPATSEKAFANVDHEFYGKAADLYGSFLFTHTENNSNLAPQPIPNIASNVTVPANNPYNPFGIDVGETSTSPIAVRYRTIDIGNRNFEQTSNYFHFVTGVRGDFGILNSGDSDYHYNLSFGYDREESLYQTFNAISASQLQLALTPSATNPFINVLGTPTYNVFGTAKDNAGSTSDAIRATLFNNGTAQLYETNGSVSGTPYQLPGGPLSFAMGGEYRVETLQISDDGITQAGDAVGIDPTASFALEKRETYAGFVEVNIPIVGPDMHVPGIHKFDFDGSGRIEDIEGGVDTQRARLNAIWEPLDSGELSLRANFSQSFIVPTLYAEFGPPTISSNQVTLVDGPSQQFISQETSPTIPNISAQTFGGGFTYSPKWAKGLTISADYYNVIQSGGAGYAPYQPEVDSLEANGSASPYAGSFVFANGSKLTSTAAGQINAGNFGTLTQEPTPLPTTQKTAGVDATVSYVLPWKQYGTFTVGATGTYLINYTDQNGIYDGAYVDKAGSFTDTNQSGGTGQGLLPKWQINPYFEYDWGGFTYNLDAEYIPGLLDYGDSNGVDGLNDFAISGDPYSVPDYYRIDMSISYEWGKSGTPGLPFFGQEMVAPDAKDAKSGKESLTSSAVNDWFDGLRVAIGVNNITDEQPEFLPSSAEDNTDKANYDIIGRFFFFQVDKKF